MGKSKSKSNTQGYSDKISGCPITPGSEKSIEYGFKADEVLSNPDNFVDKLKKDPWLIANDPVIQVAIRKLQIQCESETGKRSKDAREILKQAGLSNFIPDGIPKRRTESATLYWWESSPYILIDLVALNVKIIEVHKTKHQYKRKDLQLKKKDIGDAFEYIFGEKMPKDLIFGERDKTSTTIALTFISYEYKVPFEALKKKYHDIVKHLPKIKNQPLPFKLP